MNKKYELTDEKIEINVSTLYRIRALREFSFHEPDHGNSVCVKKGDLGGWIQKESNLSQDGNCWIHHNAMAFENSEVSENAQMFDESMVCGNSKLKGKTIVIGTTVVLGNLKIAGNAIVSTSVS